MCDGRWIRRSPVLNGPKEGRVSPFWDLDDGGFFPAFSIEILVQLETQLPHMNPYGTVLNDAIALGLAKNSAANSVFAQILDLASN